MKNSITALDKKNPVIANTEITNKGKLTKELMLKYVRENGNREDQIWFFNLCRNNIKEKTNNVRGGTYKTIDHEFVREEFCQHFQEFYHLSSKAKQEARVDTSFFDWMDEFASELDENELDENELSQVSAVA